MGSNPYHSYYALQSGTGISSYQGVRWQKGHSFFGRLLRRAAYPILKFLGREALSTGADIAKHVLSGSNIKDAAKGRLKEHGKKVAERAISKIEEMTQKQAGTRRRRRRRVKPKSTRRSTRKTKGRRKTRKSSIAQIGGGINIRRARRTVQLTKSNRRSSVRKTKRKGRKPRSRHPALSSFVL